MGSTLCYRLPTSGVHLFPDHCRGQLLLNKTVDLRHGSKKRSVPGRNHSRQFNLECGRQVTTGHKRPAQLFREHSLAEGVLSRWRK
jgi:hypothetical protein